jgi:apolipoprotein N-acyltransferase
VLHALALGSSVGWALAWVALVPLLIVAARASPARIALAAVTYVVTLLFIHVPPFLTPAVGRYFHLAPFQARLAVGAVLGPGALLSAIPLALALALRRRGGRPLGVLFPAALWALSEPLRIWFPPFFPVAMLATSQADVAPVLQIASVTGWAGITALLAGGNAAFANLVLASSPRRRLAPLAAVAVLGAAIVGWGSARPARAGRAAAGAPFRVLLVDGAAARAADSTLDRYLAVTSAHLDPLPDLIVWPESALPIDLERDVGAWTRLRAFVDAHDTALVTGAAGTALGAGRRLETFNSVHVLRPRYAMLSYHKRLLVPFAEAWPPILGAPPSGLEPVAAGGAQLVAEVGARRFGPLVCFEIVDAASVRALARLGVAFVVNVNNDAYWDDAAAPHLVWARIRAVESGRPVVRATNRGTSAVFDPFGRVVASTRSAGEPATLAASMPAPVDTVYVRTGELLLPACCLIVLTGLVPRRRA